MPLAKRLVEAGILLSGAAAVSRLRRRGRGVVLAYHNVVEESSSDRGDTSLHIASARFRRHLNAIEQFCDVVPLSAIRDAPAGNRPRVAITFDDAYRGAVRLALPELARRGLPATVFVPPAFVPDGTFWWDDIGRLPGSLSDATRTTALNECRGRDAEVRRHYAEALRTLPPDPDLQCATEEELRSAVSAGEITLGSHTWSHPNLARATPSELADELSRPLAWLREHFPASCAPILSYPYGLESAGVRSAARDAGYTMGFRVTGGWLPAEPSDPFSLPRLNVPAGMSANGLALRLSGLFA
jgi:peptidoglycan/xylan/chitin deacetylase (PgdA/CDA1 family)